MGAWAGGVAQGISAKNARRDLNRANAQLTERMGISQRAYEEQRPKAVRQRFDALQQQLGMYDPAAAMMGEMTGGRYRPSTTVQNPVAPVQATMAQVEGNDALPFGQWSRKEQNKVMNEWRRKGYDVSNLDALRRKK